MADIRTMLDGLEIAHLNFEGRWEMMQICVMTV